MTLDFQSNAHKPPSPQPQIVKPKLAIMTKSTFWGRGFESALVCSFLEWPSNRVHLEKLLKLIALEEFGKYSYKGSSINVNRNS